MFAGFGSFDIKVEGATIHGMMGGVGPPLLLLHGYPQTHVIWHKIAGRLAEKFTVVATDLRGYGDSSKPISDVEHLTYSKRIMARDQVQVMRSLGYGQFQIIGHDRGGRVGHRLALDHPEAVSRLVVMDIAPTYSMYHGTDLQFAEAYYHWFFLIQPFDLPEQLIATNRKYYLEKKMGKWGGDRLAITEEAFDEYLRCFTDDAIHASCEDYRASASIDLQHDQKDLDKGIKIQCPVLCLWGSKGFVGHKYDVMREWLVWADDVEGAALPCGHYLPEEAPEYCLNELNKFLVK